MSTTPEWSAARQNRIVLNATCGVHQGPRGFANLVVRKLPDGRIEFDPHVTGACVVTVEIDGARKLVEALVRWLG
ncbi:MAG: hypothetical protein JO281_02875 [Pseudonocardiales bacterium]|nr:hypothetical protein [Pseudonocardiales bacterium]